ncbi:MAG: hypothetical protein H0X42_14045 [Solirubrobacterales bacterium]|nr:hypothetical protein [Solirubrobacterales bacterium]
MSAETSEPAGAASKPQIEEAERRLQAAADLATKAEQRAEAEIKALEADLERARADGDAEIAKLRLAHEEALEREREAKRQAIAAAEERLGEIEAQADAAEERIATAERRAAESERMVAEEMARAREAAAAWLRGQIDSIRREAEKR